MKKIVRLLIALIIFVIGVDIICCCTYHKPDKKPPQGFCFPASDPQNTGNWMLVPELSDEFEDASIDENKWNRLYPDWDGRFPSWYVEDNTSVADGKLHITMKKEHLPEMGAGYEYSTGILRSKKTFLYGYAEVKAKCMNSHGSSAFWLNNAQSDWWTEIDVFEISGNHPDYETTIFTNVHEFYNPDNVIEPFVDDDRTHFDKPQVKVMSWRPADDYHIYGVEWSSSTIKWYVDGVLIRELENTNWSQEFYVIVDSEVMQEWWGLPADEDLPSTYTVEYIRVWQSL